MNFSMESMFAKIAEEFSSKEFTKEDLINKFTPKQEPKKDQYEWFKSNEGMRNHVNDLKRFRITCDSNAGLAWKELYDNEEFCKIIMETDISKIIKINQQHDKEKKDRKQAKIKKLPINKNLYKMRLMNSYGLVDKNSIDNTWVTKKEPIDISDIDECLI